MSGSIRTSPPVPALPEGFEAIIAEFTRSAAELQETHEVLHDEVASLRRELSDARDRLARSQQLASLGEMAAGIAHEIRNPLGSIRLYAEALVEDLDDRNDERTLAEKIVRAVTGLDEIVRDVLRFSRDHRPDPRPARLGAIAGEAVDRCDGLLAQHGVEIVRDSLVDAGRGLLRPGPAGDADDADATELDAVLVGQAVGNVVRNAIEAVADLPEERRRIHVSVGRRPVRTPDGDSADRLVLAVRDHGPGVPAEIRDRMFNPFFTTRATGTGLGLAIVHRIVDAHGGHVQVDDAPGGGACVSLCLPPSSTSPDDAVDIEITDMARSAMDRSGVPS